MARLDNYFTQNEIKNRKRTFDTGRIYLAEVMDTRNVTRSGDIKVWVIGSDINRDDSERWITASYASPFFGNSVYEPTSTNDFEQAPISFGLWFPIPFVGNRVFIFYPCISGENLSPYWFACPINPVTNSMIPGIPSQFYDNEHIPMTELNDKISKSEYTARRTSWAKKESGQGEYTPLKEALKRQGLDKDKLRGYSTAGTKREAPSMCYGILSPLGNSFVMDDGWSKEDNRTTWNDNADDVNSQKLQGSDGLMPNQRVSGTRYNAGFRFRTRNGTQLLVSDDGNIYAINRDGTAWAEITDDGRIQGYAKTSADIACDGDINLNSKKKIRMEAKEGFVFKTDGDISIESSNDINISTPNIKANSILTTPEINVTDGNIENFTSMNGKINGEFGGIFNGEFTGQLLGNVTGNLSGIAASAVDESKTFPTFEPIQASEKPETPKPEIPEPTIEEVQEVQRKKGESEQTIVSVFPSAEPYSGHDKNDDIPNLDISVIATKESDKSSESQVISNQIQRVLPKK